MIYSQFYLKKQIRKSYIVPSLISGILGFVIVMAMNLIVIESGVQDLTEIPQNVEIVNISDTQAGIYWRTYEPKMGWVIYGESQDKTFKIAFDQRDTQSGRGRYRNHLIHIKDLKPNSKYYFKIVNEGKIYSHPNSYFTTTQNINKTAKPLALQGRAVYSDGSSGSGAIVFFGLEDAYRIATATKTTGEWFVYLPYVVEKKKNTPSEIAKNENLNIQVISEDGLQSNVQTTVANANLTRRPILIGQDYQIKNDGVVLAAKTSKSQEIKSQGGFIILYPKNNAVVPGNKPLIKGVAPPNRELRISIDSQPPQNFRVVSDYKGDWEIKNVNDLKPGKYKLSLIVNDNQRRLVSTVNFIIGKSGEAVLGDATASAGISPTVEPLPTEATDKTTKIVVKPTLVPTMSPDYGYTYTAKQIGGNQNIIPIVGTTSYIWMVIAGLVLAVFGIAVFFLF